MSILETRWVVDHSVLGCGEKESQYLRLGDERDVCIVHV